MDGEPQGRLVPAKQRPCELGLDQLAPCQDGATREEEPGGADIDEGARSAAAGGQPVFEIQRNRKTAVIAPLGKGWFSFRVLGPPWPKGYLYGRPRANSIEL